MALSHRALPSLRFEGGLEPETEIEIKPDNLDNELAAMVEVLPIALPTDPRLAGLIAVLRSGVIRDATFTPRTFKLLYDIAQSGWHNYNVEVRLKTLYILTKTMLLPEFPVGEEGTIPSQSFLAALFEQVNGQGMSTESEHPYLKQVIFYLYDKIPTLRQDIRKYIGQCLKNFVLIADRSIAVVVLLEVTLHIIQGFQEPFTGHHASLLRHVLLPLHLVNKTMGGVGTIATTPMGTATKQVSIDGQPILAEFHPALVRCEMEFIKQDSSYALECAKYILDHWPEQRAGVSAKEVLLLLEIDKLVEHLDEAAFGVLLPALKSRLLTCISGTFAMIAQRALHFWKNTHFVKLSESYKNDITPDMVMACYRGHNPHWNATVNRLSASVLESLREQDPELFEKACDQHVHRLHSRERIRALSAQSPTKPRSAVVRPLPAIAVVPNSPFVASPRASMGMGWKGGSDQPPSTITGVAVRALPVTRPASETASNLSATPVIAEDAEMDDSDVMVIDEDTAINSMASPETPSTPNTIDEVDPRTAEEVLASRTGLELALEFIQKNQQEERQHDTEMNSMADTPTLLPDLLFHHLVFGDVLGSGAFSTVKFAKHITRGMSNTQWPQYAIKIVSIEKIQEHGYEASMAREISILKMMNHPGITRLVADFRWRDGVYLVLEYAELGDLHSYILKNGSLDDASTQFVVGEILAALTSIHSKGFVFADLKPENVVLTKNGHAKLTDFGGARPLTAAAKDYIAAKKAAVRKLREGDHGWRAERDRVKKKVWVNTDLPIDSSDSTFTSTAKAEADTTSDSTDNSNTEVDASETEPAADDDARIEGTTIYLPPEVATGGRPDFPTDAWALGCLLYQCLAGRPPIWAETESETLAAIVRFSDTAETRQDIFSSVCSTNAKALVEALLEPKMAVRATLADAAAHQFFAGVDVFALYKKEAPQLVQGAVAPEPEAKCNQRNISRLWLPQTEVDLKSSAVPSLLGFGLKYATIVETDVERNAPFSDVMPKLFENDSSSSSLASLAE